MKKSIVTIRSIMICLWNKEEKEDIGVLDVLTKEVIRIALSVKNNWI
ncbi:MAG: hypothetical protein KHX42_00840 [Prevotella sp.]|nr:hypothetical protein [Prevotella sp.]